MKKPRTLNNRVRGFFLFLNAFLFLRIQSSHNRPMKRNLDYEMLIN